jgi:branched-subunit amino acid aminotransferase/4-amino-4-deoxychorismate lyase
MPMDMDGRVCLFDGRFVPGAESKVGVMTHTFNSGTGCFEGMRAYWHAGRQGRYVLKGGAHSARFETSRPFLRIALAAAVFLVAGDRRITPSSADDIPSGITRQPVIDLVSAELGLTVEQRHVAGSVASLLEVTPS